MIDFKKTKTVNFNLDLEDPQQMKVLQTIRALPKGLRARMFTNLVLHVTGDSSIEAMTLKLKAIAYGSTESAIKLQEEEIEACASQAIATKRSLNNLKL